jgi:hypothetical protein
VPSREGRKQGDIISPMSVFVSKQLSTFTIFLENKLVFVVNTLLANIIMVLDQALIPIRPSLGFSTKWPCGDDAYMFPGKVELCLSGDECNGAVNFLWLYFVITMSKSLCVT